MSTDIKTEAETENDALWRLTFLEGNPQLMDLHGEMMRYRATKRCRLCKAPFDGEGPLPNREPSDRNEYFCSQCDVWIINHHPGGVESDFPVIAVDMRRSTETSEQEGSGKFYSRYLEPFFTATIQPLADTDGFVAESRGDEVRGVYPPGFSGADHVKKMVEAARRLLQDMPPKTPEGIPIPFGIGIHIGDIRIGTSPKTRQVAIAGPGVNICSHICEQAARGEALISEALISEVVYERLGLPTDSLEKRRVPLKGKKEPVLVYVMTAQSAIEPFPIVH